MKKKKAKTNRKMTFNTTKTSTIPSTTSTRLKMQKKERFISRKHSIRTAPFLPSSSTSLKKPRMHDNNVSRKAYLDEQNKSRNIHTHPRRRLQKLEKNDRTYPFSLCKKNTFIQKQQRIWTKNAQIFKLHRRTSIWRPRSSKLHHVIKEDRAKCS